MGPHYIDIPVGEKQWKEPLPLSHASAKNVFIAYILQSIKKSTHTFRSNKLQLKHVVDGIVASGLVLPPGHIKYQFSSITVILGSDNEHEIKQIKGLFGHGDITSIKR